MVCTVSPRYGRYVFRGESDSDHHLIPYAYRTESKGGRISGRERMKEEAERYLKRQWLILPEDGLDMGQNFYEIAALLWFYDLANRQGLRVPDIPHISLGNEFFEAQKQSSMSDSKDFLEKWSDIAAVAQHYGVPTRMLDWTFDVNRALYFAVMKLPDNDSDAEHPNAISLWALDKSRISTMDGGVKIVVPKYCDNPNISAQSGLFTLLIGDDPGKDLEKLIGGISVNEKTLSKFIMEHDCEPVLKKIDIPYGEAVKIKKNLEGRGMNYHSAFPGWDGVVRSMEIQSGIRKA